MNMIKEDNARLPIRNFPFTDTNIKIFAELKLPFFVVIELRIN
jgi:hypothetical protein